jgi:hypothetical protein
MRLNHALLAGLAGTTAMTLLILVAPMMGMPEMYIGNMLGDFLGIGSVLGWIMHFVIGVVLAVGYALLFAGRLPGHVVARGAIYGFLVFLLAQLMVMPMMGAGVFSGGNVPMIMGSLLGHLVYGGVLGAVYGPTTATAAA